MGVLSGKKILLIAPAYHNYIFNIALAFKNLGAEIEAYSQNPTSIFFTNFYLSRLEKFPLFKKLYSREILRTNKHIVNSIRGKHFDHVVIIKGDLLTDDSLKELKVLLPDSNFVLYQWDPIKHYNYMGRVSYFNAVYSFDYADCLEYTQITYLPLFFTEEYAKMGTLADIQYEYDFFFLGFNHSIRVQKLLGMIDYFEKVGLKYSVNLMTTISEKYKLGPDRKKINCFFTSLKFSQFAEKYTKSKAIIDISSPQQTGLPIRIIEAIGANKKIITTNFNIINEEFYDPKMIFIWGKDNPGELNEFLNHDHTKSSSENYSIESFVLNLIRGS